MTSKTLKLAKQIGDPRCQVRAIANMGLAFLRSNHRSKARTALKAGLICARRIGDKRGGALVLRNLAEFHWQSHDFPTARRFARRSLVISEECGDMWYQARALYWLARSRWRISRELLSCALASYTKIGAADHPEAKEIEQYIHGGEAKENLPQKPHNPSVERTGRKRPAAHFRR